MFNKGVKEGYQPRSSLCLEDVDQRGTILNQTSQIFAYADDIMIISRSRQRLVELYKELITKSARNVNINKTKYILISTSETRRIIHNLYVEGELFEAGSNFRYLGCYR